MTPYLHCDPSSTHISALLALRLFFIFAPRRALSVHLFRPLTANVLSKPFLPPAPAGARQAVALGPRREYHLTSALRLSWFLSCPELQVDFPRAAPIGLALAHAQATPPVLSTFWPNEQCTYRRGPGAEGGSMSVALEARSLLRTCYI